MESKIYLIKNVKDKEKMRQSMLEKVRGMVSPNARLDGNMIVVEKEGQWAKSRGTVILTDKGNDVEAMFSSSHSATNLAIGAGCVLLLFTVLLVVVPWLLYDQEKGDFEKGMDNVLRYFAYQQ